MGKEIKKVILLGSGALKIGQAGEFDYSGSQAIKALKEEGIEVVLINPNIATIQTSKGFADKVYFLPVTPYFVEEVIRKERPDGILLAFGGQTALNCGVELFKDGIFEKYGVEVLGTDVKTIMDTEDRKLFVSCLDEIGVKTAKSETAESVDEAVAIAEEIGYPVMVRVAYALGGLGSGVHENQESLTEALKKIFKHSGQVLVEEFLGGWKEVEYEVVRDRFDNCVTVCNMENLDPMGIHTGESIVVAPSQTLTNSEYHKLREIATRVIRHLGIVGECNIQYALDPKSEEYRVIEVNARLSRSSALASKATGYPLAFVAAKLALGKSLIDIKNSVTRSTTACFEPALDYVVLKYPKWDLDKFRNVSRTLGSEMKSVGEVMSIGRNFEEVLQKAVRMLGGFEGVVCSDIEVDDVDIELQNPTPMRLFAVVRALQSGYDVDKIHELTKIDKWFLYKIKHIVETADLIKDDFSSESLRYAKRHGFSDRQIGILTGKSEDEVREIRKDEGILPFVKQIDTLAAEYPAQTNYLYLTYDASSHDVDFSKDNNIVAVLGSGPYKIGSSVEFDWCCVNSVMTSKKLGYDTIMINYNPETVSTDYDECDKLYFEELSLERVLDIYELENPHGVIVSMGGQIPNNLALPLFKRGVNVLGTSPVCIDNAEDRHKFSRLCDENDIDQPDWKDLASLGDVEEFADRVGYPVLIRPSYVLSGATMKVVYKKEDLEHYLAKASKVSPEHPVVVSKYLENSHEVDVDAVAKDGEVVTYAISEHVEKAGIHSGDATLVLPSQNISEEVLEKIKVNVRKLAQMLKISGPFNAQFIVRGESVKVIECNVRASRSLPFCSKVFDRNFVDVATRVILGEDVNEVEETRKDLGYVGVKCPQFSYSRLKNTDPLATVEMASTGEVGCIGSSVGEAYLKSALSTDLDFPKKGCLISLSGDENRLAFLEYVKKLKAMGVIVYATRDNYRFYKERGIETVYLHKIQYADKTPNILDYMVEGKIDLIISVPRDGVDIVDSKTYVIRRSAVDFSIPLISNMNIARLFVDSILKNRPEDLRIKSWDEYVEGC